MEEFGSVHGVNDAVIIRLTIENWSCPVKFIMQDLRLTRNMKISNMKKFFTNLSSTSIVTYSFSRTKDPRLLRGTKTTFAWSARVTSI